MRATEQQLAMVDVANSGDNVKGNAFAGTGKSTVCRMIAKSIAPRRVLYGAFNKATAAEMQKKMPKSVKSTTWHSLANGQMRPFIGDRLGSIVGLAREIKDDRVVYPVVEVTQDRFGAAMVTVRTLLKFVQSARERPSGQDVPAAFVASVQRRDRKEAVRRTAKAASRLWDMVCEEGSALPITHDFYLKAWALGGPQLPYDVVMIDECQDSNPVTLDLIMRQAAQQIYVGDKHQQIYEFRGAVNAMEVAEGVECPLTESFRFGRNVAARANEVLAMLGEDLPLVGSGEVAGEVFDDPLLSWPAGAVLCRGNAGVIREVVDALEKEIPVAVVGGTEEAVKTLKAAYDLFCGNKARHPELCYFDTWGELQDFADTDEGAAYRPVVGIVDRYRGGVPYLCRQLEWDTVPEHKADLVVSTAHKAKGREWDDVRFSDDFKSLVEDTVDGNGTVHRRFAEEEARLVYVSITRAQKRLNLAGYGESIRDDARKLSVDLEERGRVSALANAPTSLF